MSAIVEWYKDTIASKYDPRTSDWFLVSGPGPLLMVIVSYIYFCTSAGPRYMKDRKPYDLRNIMIAYNFIQILFSVYLCYEGSAGGWMTNYSFYCQPVDYSDNPQALRMARAVHFYFICKLIELLDTVFFVLRKKNRQISFLHLYHHSLMPICAWIGLRFLPNGHGTLLGLINSFIHVIMYTYYLLSSFGPHMNKYLWWKKYLTLMQVCQFCIILVHSSQVLVNGCNYPKFIAFLLVLNAVAFLYMFGAFYVKTYLKSRQQDGAATVPADMSSGTKNKAE